MGLVCCATYGVPLIILPLGIVWIPVIIEGSLKDGKDRKG